MAHGFAGESVACEDSLEYLQSPLLCQPETQNPENLEHEM